MNTGRMYGGPPERAVRRCVDHARAGLRQCGPPLSSRCFSRACRDSRRNAPVFSGVGNSGWAGAVVTATSCGAVATAGQKRTNCQLP